MKTQGIKALTASIALPVGAAKGMTVLSGQEGTRTILSHEVHQKMSCDQMPGTTNSSITEDCAERKGIKLNWIITNTEPTQTPRAQLQADGAALSRTH